MNVFGLPDAAPAAFACFSQTDAYVVQSEYGRILAPYFEMFPRENIMVLYTRELAQDAAAVLRRIFGFLEVGEDFTPPNLGTRYLEGAARPRSRALDIPRLTRGLRRKEIYLCVFLGAFAELNSTPLTSSLTPSPSSAPGLPVRARRRAAPHTWLQADRAPESPSWSSISRPGHSRRAGTSS